MDEETSLAWMIFKVIWFGTVAIACVLAYFYGYDLGRNIWSI